MRSDSSWAALRSCDCFLHCSSSKGLANVSRSDQDNERTHVFETTALVILEETVLAAEVALTEAAVADDALSRLLALLCGTADALAGHDVGG